MNQHISIQFKTILLIANIFVPWVLGQSASPSLATIQSDAQRDLKEALESLERTETRIANEKLAVSIELQKIEQQVISLREQIKKTKRNQNIAQTEFQKLYEINDALERELNFSQNTLQDFSVWLQSTVHPSELPMYADDLISARSTINSENDQPDWETILLPLKVAETRAMRQIGGDITEGKAVAVDGSLSSGKFLHFGPMVWFKGTGNNQTGLASEQMDSEWPIIRPVNEEIENELANLLANGSGRIPILDPKNQHHTQALPEQSMKSHIMEGGFIMIPILGMALVGVWVCILKMFDLRRNPLINHEMSQRIESHDPISESEIQNLHTSLKSIKGLGGELMESAIQSTTSEEGLFHRLYCIREKLERQVSLLSVIAATAPLLGLLGTVVGMIKTFEFITVFGVGDPRHLSGGISEALITTEFGLGVAIPCLLAHAYFQRKVRGRLHQFEHLADLLFQSSHSKPTKDSE